MAFCPFLTLWHFVRIPFVQRKVYNLYSVHFIIQCTLYTVKGLHLFLSVRRQAVYKLYDFYGVQCTNCTLCNTMYTVKGLNLLLSVGRQGVLYTVYKLYDFYSVCYTMYKLYILHYNVHSKGTIFIFKCTHTRSI